MTSKEWAQRIALLGRVLVAASLFFVLIWWRISAYLFLTGGAIALLAWVVDGAALTAPSVAQE